MTDQKPTGVFIRLPLSDEQRMVANEAPYKSDRKGSALEASILAIGTPVTGGDLKPVGKVAGHFSDGQPMVRILDRPNLPYETEIALYSDAQDQIAALEAEIARLREALVSTRDAITSHLNAKSIVCTVWHSHSETLMDYIDTILHGGAA